MSETTDKLLIESLEELRYRLEHSGVERTFGLLDAMGPECPYYRKSLSLFKKKDYADILELLRIVSERILEQNG